MEPMTGPPGGSVAASNSPNRQNFHVLLVEDDEVTLRTVEKLLKSCGYDVTLARNGKQALEVLEGAASGSRPAVDLILTDLHMPEVSGLELVDGVIHNEAYSSIPVVVMSCNDAPAAVLNCFEAGASDYLLKPIRRQELQNIWQHIWRHNPGRMASHRYGAGEEQVAARRLPAATEPSGRTLASSTRPEPPKHDQQQQQQQEQPPPQQPPQQQQEEAGLSWQPRSGSAPSEGTTPTDCSGASQQPSGGSGAAAAQAGSGREGEVPRAPIDRLHGVLAATAAAVAAEHAAPPPSNGASAGLNIAPLNLAPPPLFVQSQGAADTRAMPRGLQELAELGARREQLKRTASAGIASAASGPGGDRATTAGSSFAALHHSSTSAFTHFAALVPPPCPRGGWGTAAAAAQAAEAAPQQQQQQLAGPPTSEPSTCSSVAQLGPFSMLHPQQAQQLRAGAGPPMYPGAWGAPAAELLHQQQQRFLQALHAAIHHHQAATSHMSSEAQAHRRAAVEKFRQKRKQRTFEKKVRYESRKKLAEQRPRVKGQFVKASVAQAHAAALERGNSEGADALLKQQQGS